MILHYFTLKNNNEMKSYFPHDNTICISSETVFCRLNYIISFVSYKFIEKYYAKRQKLKNLRKKGNLIPQNI